MVNTLFDFCKENGIVEVECFARFSLQSLIHYYKTYKDLWKEKEWEVSEDILHEWENILIDNDLFDFNIPCLTYDFTKLKTKRKPCVYRWLNKNGEILYIGKTEKLKSRTKTHLTTNDNHHKWIVDWDRVEYIEFNTYEEITIAEKYFISKEKPIGNTNLKNKNIKKYEGMFDSLNWELYAIKENMSMVNIIKCKTNNKGKEFIEKSLNTLATIKESKMKSDMKEP